MNKPSFQDDDKDFGRTPDLNADAPGRRRGSKKRVGKYCADKTVVIDYKDPQALKYFISERGKVVPRRISGNCARHQRKVERVARFFESSVGGQRHAVGRTQRPRLRAEQRDLIAILRRDEPIGFGEHIDRTGDVERLHTRKNRDRDGRHRMISFDDGWNPQAAAVNVVRLAVFDGARRLPGTARSRTRGRTTQTPQH